MKFATETVCLVGCVECGCTFAPSSGDRAVTCGKACSHLRRQKLCKAWQAANKERAARNRRWARKNAILARQGD
jgi:hypothetical protein